MKRLIFFITFIFLLLFTTHNQRISSSPDNTKESDPPPLTKSEKEWNKIQQLFPGYEEWLTAEIEESGTVGAAVAVIYKGRMAHVKCFGTKKAGTPDPVDEHTVFRLASVSKSITGVLAGILASEQVIDFDECVADILPEFRLNSQVNTRQMTLRNLLSHTTGLVPHAYDDLVESHVPYGKIFSRLQQARISAPPGKLYSYQNVMFGLVDTILQVKTNKNYSQLVKQKLFDPLGMKDASTDFESFRNNPNKAYPHRGGNGIYNPIPLNNRYYNVAPAAGVNASISDMTKFLMGLLHEDNYLINRDIREMIFTPQVNSPLSSGYFRYWDKVDSKKYAIGWRIVDYKGRQIAYHGGYVSGYKSELAICPEENIGIVFLTNSPNSVASQSIPVFLNSFFSQKDKEKMIAEAKNDFSLK